MAIKCPKCQSDNPETATFCADCGTQLPSIKSIEVTETIEAPKKELTRGTTFAGRYEIIEELGKGGMGRVYRVEDKKLDQEVALKLIKPEIAKDKKTIERFRNELKLARNIRHKNVCGMFDLGETEDAHFITMEYIRGEDLKSFIHRSGQLAVGTSIRIIKQICEGLSEAHKLGVVHRDLKSNNIMIDKEGNVRIMDFGIARSLEAKGITGTGVMIGTPEYMSPEQVEGKEVDQRSDIYSLGVILYEMLTGRVPFEGNTPFTVGMKHKGEIPQNPKELNTQISNDLNHLILRCLEKEREKRYQSAEEVRSGLSSIERGIPTTEGIVPKRKPLPSKEITVTFKWKRISISALLIVAIAISAIVIWKLLAQKEAVFSEPGMPSIAVLPFEDLSPQKDQKYLCDGLAESIINALSKVQGLRIPARASSFSFRERGSSVKEIGEMLNVGVILDGSLQKARNTIRVTVKLFKVADSSLLWSEKFDKELEDVFAIQDDITLALVNKLKVSLLGGERENLVKRYTENVEAYELYLRGLYFWNKRTAEDAERALEYFEKAVEKDSEFALAYVGMADCFIILPFFTNWLPSDAYPRAREAALRALEIDDTLAEAHTSLAYVKGFYDWNWPETEREFKTAIELNPNYANGHHWYGLFLSGLGHTQEAIDELVKAHELDPLSHIVINNYGDVLYHARLYDQAIEQYRKAKEIDPGFRESVRGIGLVYLEKDMFEEAIIELGPRSSYSVFAYMSLGQKDKALALLEHFKELSNKQRVNPRIFLNVYFGMGDFDKAFEYLEMMRKEQSPYILDKVLPEPFYDRLRSDPRYKLFLQKIGLER